jgi:DHA1 family multidrug resistance protein-like MFS transporter
MFAGAFSLFLRLMYHNIGVDWAITVFGCIAAALIPIHFFFFFWGKKLRARGQWSIYSV